MFLTLNRYCDCFANGEFCFNCNCTNCYNNLHYERQRQKSIKQCLDRNPSAFRPKVLTRVFCCQSTNLVHLNL